MMSHISAVESNEIRTGLTELKYPDSAAMIKEIFWR